MWWLRCVGGNIKGRAWIVGLRWYLVLRELSLWSVDAGSSCGCSVEVRCDLCRCRSHSFSLWEVVVGGHWARNAAREHNRQDLFSLVWKSKVQMTYGISVTYNFDVLDYWLSVVILPSAR